MINDDKNLQKKKKIKIINNITSVFITYDVMITKMTHILIRLFFYFHRNKRTVSSRTNRIG